MAPQMGGEGFGARLRALRLAKGLSQVELARLIRRHPTAIGPYERDEYAPPRDVVDRIAEILDTTPEYLWFGRSPRRPTLAVVGVIGRGGSAAPSEVPLPARSVRVDAIAGWLVTDDSNAPSYRSGQLVLVAREPTPTAELIGQFVLARLADGRELLRLLLPGVDESRPLLCLASGTGAIAAELAEVRAVLGVLHAGATTGQHPDDAIEFYTDS